MAAPGIQVDVEDVSNTLDVPAAADLVHWAVTTLATSVREGELSIRIVGEIEGAALNEQYRRKHGATNVLSFPAQLPQGVPLDTFGDLVICAPVVAREAAAQGKAPEVHWAHMVVHGCLHLLGFDHELEEGAAVMESLETAILAGLGYPDPYTPR
jgi:probable rRNA maturation factor